ncbi:class III extradiol dioxygenase subunit B-like domain-containing protein [Salinispora arenicola]|uniref:class III extradiol dioxygenase subunit B-like domain-containing protein n=1 Tax=Salinispora arenicola TaxID=168697 RepID=UPI000375DC7D|nr:class III extradiol dioxygenase subunit B-like domain-containing protein [Salinispora arenicola]
MALVPLVAAAVCPHPPLLVPEVAGAAVAELDDLRLACDAVVARLLAAEPDRVVLVGGGPATTTFGAAEHGSLRGYGVDLRVPLSPAGADAVEAAGADAVGVTGADAVGDALPLSLTLGAWLLGRSGTELPRSAVAVAADESADRCAALGAGLLSAGLFGGASDRIALLVLGDGSACRGERSPGYDDPRAEPYDQAVARALADADAGGLLGLDAELSAGLKAAGRASWQVLAGAVRATGGPWHGELAYAGAPFGVTYLVASWTPAGAAR